MHVIAGPRRTPILRESGTRGRAAPVRPAVPNGWEAAEVAALAARAGRQGSPGPLPNCVLWKPEGRLGASCGHARCPHRGCSCGWGGKGTRDTNGSEVLSVSRIGALEGRRGPTASPSPRPPGPTARSRALCPTDPASAVRPRSCVPRAPGAYCRRFPGAQAPRLRRRSAGWPSSSRLPRLPLRWSPAPALTPPRVGPAAGRSPARPRAAGMDVPGFSPAWARLPERRRDSFCTSVTLRLYFGAALLQVRSAEPSRNFYRSLMQ